MYPYGGGVATTTTYVSVPQTYSRVVYSYPSFYDRRMDFMMPIGVDPATAALFMQASQIFRQFDLNWSGTLDIYEWKRAMFALGYYMSDFDADRLFWMIDTDRSGQISEREFCEYWAFARRGGAPMAPMAPVGYAAPMPGYAPMGGYGGATTTVTYSAPAPYY